MYIYVYICICIYMYITHIVCHIKLKKEKPSNK